MLSGVFVLSLILQATYSQLTVDKRHQYDFSIALEIKSQFPEVTTIVFCYDKQYENFHLTDKLIKKLNTNVYLINYHRTQNTATEENLNHFYIVFFQDILNLKHFIDHLNHRIQILLILSIRVTLDDINHARKLCRIIKVYLIDMSTSKLLVCIQGVYKKGNMQYVNYNKKNLPKIRNILNFHGRSFKVGTSMFPTRLEYR